MSALRFRQLCAIARASFTSPDMLDADWVAEIKRRVARGGWDYPRPDQITGAIRAVERFVERTPVVSQMPQRVELHGKPWPLSRTEAADAYQEIERRFRATLGRES